MAGAVWNCCRRGAFCVYHATMSRYFMQSHVGCVMRACSAVTCHLHFWQNDRDFVHAAAVTRGWNGYRNKTPAQKVDPGERFLFCFAFYPATLPGLEPATFLPRVRRSNHWAISAPSCTDLPSFTNQSVCFNLTSFDVLYWSWNVLNRWKGWSLYLCVCVQCVYMQVIGSFSNYSDLSRLYVSLLNLVEGWVKALHLSVFYRRVSLTWLGLYNNVI